MRLKRFRDELLPLATVVTPNLPEAERLTGQAITSNQAMVTAGHALQGLGADNVIIKGGHGDNPDLANDFVLLADGPPFGFRLHGLIRCGPTAREIPCRHVLPPN